MKGDERKWGKESKRKGARMEKMERIQNTTFNNNTRAGTRLAGRPGNVVRVAAPLSWAAAVKTRRRSSGHSSAGGTGSACWWTGGGEA